MVQLKKTDEQSYEVKIRPGETHMFDNNPFRSLVIFKCSTLIFNVCFRDDVTEEEYRAANRAAKMKGRCDDEPRKPRVRKVKDKTPL